MSNLENNVSTVDASLEVTRSEANKILKLNGYKVANNDIDAFVSLKDINKIYPNGVQAVYDFNINIEQNDFIVLVGPSGCGKSTTLRMIAGLEDITSGYLYIDKVLSNYSASKDRDISMVFQNYALYPQMTVFDNIAFPLRAKKYRRPMYSKVLRSWNEVIYVLENRLSEFVVAINEANNKELNFGTQVEYVATKLSISDEASKLLCKYRIKKEADLENINKEGKTLYQQIKETSELLIQKEKTNLVKKGYFVGENYCLYKNDELQYSYVKMSKEEIRKRVFEAAEILDLGSYLDRRPKELSGGQMQRVALGRAIVRNAKLFLMDEPLSNLDAKLRVQMRSEIVRIHEQIGATTIYVTHDQTEAMTMATKIVVMSKGWVQQIGTPQEIYDNPKNIFVATFIGSPATNIYNAKYNNGEIIFDNGYKVKLDNDFINKHNKYYEDKIADLERMLNTDDFKKMKALKVIDKVVFNLDKQIDYSLLSKTINEVIELANGYEYGGKIKDLLSIFINEKYEELLKEISCVNEVNTKKFLLKVQEVSNEFDSKIIELDDIIKMKLNELNAVELNSTYNLYNSYIENIRKALDIVDNNSSVNKTLLSKLELLNIENEINKDNKNWILSMRRPLLSFEKIPSSDIGKLHNAQVLKKDEVQVNDTLYYQKPKKKKKVNKVHVNLNSVDIEFVNNLYEVANKLLEKSKEALLGEHDVRVGVRPEDIHLSHEFDGNASEGFNVNANVVELLGSELLIHTNWANTNMIAKISTGTLIKPHSNVELTFNKDKILIFDECSGDTI